MKIVIREQEIIRAANAGMDEFILLFANSILKGVGGQLTADNMSELNADQITLLAYIWLRDEVMDGGFIQLIHNGYGAFIFENPFAKAVKQWGIRDLSKLLYNARNLYLEYGKDIEKDCNDEEFMAMFERFSAFDDMDDCFVEHEEEWTEMVARYLDEHINNFATIE